MGDDLCMKEEFNNYKEKQSYYKERAKQEKMVWFSKEPNNPRKQRVGLIKGRTYRKRDVKDVRNDTV